MTTAVMSLNDWSLFDLGDTGVSEDSQKVRKITRDVICHRRQGSARLEGAFDSLISVYLECSEENWDGHDATPISKDVFYEAEKLLYLLPSSLPIPEIVPEPSGTIALEWYKKKDFVFIVSVRGEGTISYAGLFGKTGTTYGTEYFGDKLPSLIIDNIRRFFS
jgi:hypothetical protein